jgi:hypothetical protein
VDNPYISTCTRYNEFHNVLAFGAPKSDRRLAGMTIYTRFLAYLRVYTRTTPKTNREALAFSSAFRCGALRSGCTMLMRRMLILLSWYSTLMMTT